MDENMLSIDLKASSMPFIIFDENMEESVHTIEINSDITVCTPETNSTPVTVSTHFSSDHLESNITNNIEDQLILDCPKLKSKERKMPGPKIRKGMDHHIKLEKNNYRKQLFTRKWLDLPEFQSWLTDTISPNKAYCKCCRREITAGKSELQRHSKSKYHIKRFLEHEAIPAEHQEDLVEWETNNNEEIVLRSAVVTRIIDLRSDSLSAPCPAMKKAMFQEQSGSQCNSDTKIEDLESAVAVALHKEAGLFFPTNTMANLVAVMAHCRNRGSAVIFGDKSDIGLNNRDALVKFGRLHCCSIENQLNGTFSIDALEEIFKNLDVSFMFENLVCLETAHAKLGGVVPSLDWLRQLSDICKCYNTLIHCDGARLANASIYLNEPLSDIVKDCDSVTFGLDKSLGAPLGAVVAGDAEFIKRCLFLRNSIGGHIHQAGILGAAGAFALKSMPAIVEEHQKAMSISIGISKLKSKIIEAVDVQTNVIHIKCVPSKLPPNELLERLRLVNEEEDDVGILCEEVNEDTVALWLHKDITLPDVRDTVSKFCRIITELNEEFGQPTRRRSNRPAKRKKNTSETEVNNCD